MQLPPEENLLNNKRQQAGAAFDFFDPITIGLLDSLPFYVMLIDKHHHILLANWAVRNQLGLDPEEILGEHCPKIVHGINQGSYAGCPLEEAVATGGPVENEHYDEKTSRWLRIAIYPTGTMTPEGEEIFFHMIIDVTDRKQAQEDLANSEEKYRMLLEGLLKSTEQ